MDSRELAVQLVDFGFSEGFAIRNGFIVLWENETAIPKSLEDYVALDVNE